MRERTHFPSSRGDCIFYANYGSKHVQSSCVLYAQGTFYARPVSILEILRNG
ncbi:hypothetical protein REMIM1_CH01785 [Rhizobium etli bv. mimosae str. Mim1]|nr:hypothetical protein REMIM1_CH01785 [Rhizobium etli bv. mimosae str. Mim1]